MEKHLKAYADEPMYQFLWSTWITEKEINRKRLETIHSTFKTYSSHNAEHSEIIILMIELLLGEDRIRLLSPTDTWLILQCAYTHDIGMCVGEKEKEALSDQMIDEYLQNPKNVMGLLESENFQSYLNDLNNQALSETNTYSTLYSSARFVLRKIQSSKAEKEKFSNLLNSMEFSKAKNIFSEVTMNYFRRNHAQRSRDILLREVEEKLYKDIFVARLRRIVAYIDYSHGATWDYILKQLPAIDNGIHSDYIHPQFVAALLRMGDLLDIDSNRFNPFLLDQAGDIPISSAVHKLKHMSISRLMVNTKYIDIESRYEYEKAKKFMDAHCFSDQNALCEKQRADIVRETVNNSIKIQRYWLNMIADELKNISLNWNTIIPENMTGSIAMLRVNDIYYEDQLVENDELELRYKISPERASKIIEGADLYNHPLTFIRELVQNAIDSTKKQLYRVLSMSFENTSQINTEKIVENYEVFYNLLKKYRVRVSFTYVQSEQEAHPPKLSVKISDNGIGITYDKLKKMRHIGDVIMSDKEKVMIAKMPEWMKPTGEFGIEMQSVFTVADRFVIHTCPQITEWEEDRAKHTIHFYCTELGGDIVNIDETRKEDDLVKTDVEFDIEFDSENLHKFFEYDSLYSNRKRMTSIIAPEVIKNKLLRYIEKTFTDDLIGVDFFFEVRDGKDNIDEEKFHTVGFPQCYHYRDISPIEGTICLLSCTPKSSQDDKKSKKLSDKACQNDCEKHRDDTIVFWYNKHDTGEAQKDCSVLMTMKNVPNSLGTLRTYFKGILINEEDPSSDKYSGKLGIFKIPGLDLKINIMSGKAGEFLEINRDYIKNEGYEFILHAIQSAFKSFYQTIYHLYKTYKKGENIKLFQSIGRFLALNSKHFLMFWETAKIYEADFEDKAIMDAMVHTVPEYEPQINIFTFANNVTHSKRLNYSKFSSMLLSVNDIYYTKGNDIIYPTRGSYTVKDNEETNNLIAVEDCISSVYDLSYQEIISLESDQFSLSHQLFYRLSDDVSFTKIGDMSYRILCQNTLKQYIEEYINTGEKQYKGDMLPSLPAIEKYQNIALSKIMVESPDELADRYNRFILLPINISDFARIYDITQHKFLDLIEKEVFTSKTFENIYKTIMKSKKRKLDIEKIRDIYINFFNEVLAIQTPFDEKNAKES